MCKRWLTTALVAAMGLACLGIPKSQADVRLPKVLANHMVLQRDVATNLWGWADAGEEVRVSFMDKNYSTTADDKGQWKIQLPSQKAGGPYDIAIEGKNQLAIKDVLFGDVWVCSGQSNMQWTVNLSNNAKEEIAAANYPNIRLCQVKRVVNLEPQSDMPAAWNLCTPDNVAGFSAVGYFFGRDLHKDLNVPIGLVDSSWGGTPAEAWSSMASLKNDPELAYVVERYEQSLNALPLTKEELARKVKEWEAKTYCPDPENRGFEEGWARPDYGDGEWPKMPQPGYWENLTGDRKLKIDGIVWLRKTIDIPAAWAGKDLQIIIGSVDDCDTTYFNGKQVGRIGLDTPNYWSTKRDYTVPAELVKAGKATIAMRIYDRWQNGGCAGPITLGLKDGSSEPISLAGDWKYQIEYAQLQPARYPSAPAGPMDKNPHTPAALYNAMIHPMIQMPIKGAIWYQGESNAGRAYKYRSLLATMIQGWRQAWNQPQFPFYIVQLANFTALATQPIESNWAELREAQNIAAAKVGHSGVAVIIDIGEANDIHPKNKQDVGKRLELLALRDTYGQKKLVAESPKIKSFARQGNKIVIKFDQVGTGLKVGPAPQNPNLSQEEKTKLQGFAIAAKDEAFVWAQAKITAPDTIEVWNDEVAEPADVRYAWANNPTCNLYNSADLPANPFRTDDRQISTLNAR